MAVNLKERRTAVYVACEDFNFFWSERDVAQMEHMWREGLPVSDMAVAFRRDPDEVALLVMDRVRHGYIHKRRGGVYGDKRE